MVKHHFLLLLTIAVAVALVGCGQSTTSPESNVPVFGSAKIALFSTSSYFNDVADSAIVKISADDISTITQGLTIGVNTVTGTVNDIPVGPNRLFEIFVYDEADSLQYYGHATAEIIRDTITNVTINLVRVTGGSIINGTIVETAGVSVTTTPSGATIYLDGTLISDLSPTTLTTVTPGQHHIRIYKNGYNEYNETFTYVENQVYAITITLEVPAPPYPVITFTAPTNDETFNDNVISVSGSIVLDNSDPFTDDMAILSLNGIEQQVSVVSGTFNVTISISNGDNTIVMRANGPNGATGVSSTLTVHGSFTEPDIEITLSWNTPNSDIDLHTWNPLGEHSSYSNKGISDGYLDIDDTVGYGPETFTAETGLSGVYTVKVNSYNLKADSYSDATVIIKIKGHQPVVYGPHHFSVADYNGSNPDAWWEVATFTVSGGVAKIAVPSWLEEKIESDMLSLPAK
jgi:hypothetical protein